MNDARPLLLRALAHEDVPRTPIWIMRQAGRYLPEYREIRRAAGSFLTMLRTPEHAVEVTLQPLRRYALDAAIIFSDILTLADAWGLGLHYREGEGPGLERPIRDRNDLASLPSTEIMDARLDYVYESIRLVVRELPPHIPLIGFTASPWTLACYVLGGGREFEVARKGLHVDPAFMTSLLERCARDIARHLALQVSVGAKVAMIFDTWGGLVDAHSQDRILLPTYSRLMDEFRASPETRSCPLILYTRGGDTTRFRRLCELGFDALGLDSSHDLRDVYDALGGKVALQGNLDVHVLYGDDEHLWSETRALLENYGARPGHVFNLGQGISPDVDPERVATLVQAVRTISTEIRARRDE